VCSSDLRLVRRGYTVCLSGLLPLTVEAGVGLLVVGRALPQSPLKGQDLLLEVREQRLAVDHDALPVDDSSGCPKWRGSTRRSLLVLVSPSMSSSSGTDFGSAGGHGSHSPFGVSCGSRAA